uniref:BHLH domain-containing protein n=1 Tax=Ananas comosus var. bracteatus TaxID=296719 RepID=A0A6V7P484_ANACO|nr:unnamed protein product [Ananas comosus var. bracteatus]
MQPCSREMQAIAASLSAIGIQPLLGGVSGGDEFLEQMLAAAPSAAWCDHMAEDPSPPPQPPPPVATRYTPYDPIGAAAAAAAAPASSAAELGLFAPAIGDGGSEIDPSSSFKSLNPTGGEGIYAGGFGGFLSVPAAQRASMSFGITPTNAEATVTTTAPKQRVRARRGQATDPHSIAERLRRERIAERMKALQELVPNANKTDKASMLDEIIDYVKFLQLQVKVLSVSRLGGAAAAAPLVGDLSSERRGGGGGGNETLTAATEKRVAQMMEEDMGTAMQYLQGKGLCLMPISLASAISSATSSPSVAADQ